MPTAAKIQWPQGQPLFEVQWRAVAESLAGNGVRSASDLEVQATTNDLEIEVTSGTTYYVGSESTLNNAETHTLSAGDGTYRRWDTVYFDTSADSSGVREGTPAADPEPPDVQGDELLLAVVYVPQNATDVPDSDVLNWRAQFSNQAEEVHYDDDTGVYGVSDVDAALDELQEAAQITAYPLAPSTDLDVNGYPFLNSDIENSSITANAGNGLTTTNAGIGLGGSATLAVDSSVVDLEFVRSGDNAITGTLAVMPEDTMDFGPVLNMSISGSDTAGTRYRYGFGINNGEVLRVEAESDGSGGSRAPRMNCQTPIIVDAESTTPTVTQNGAMYYDQNSDTPKWANGNGTFERPTSRQVAEQFNTDETGTVNSGNSGVVYSHQVPDGSAFEVYRAGLLLADGQPAPSDLDLALVTLDNAGAAAIETTIITGDGTVQGSVTGSPLASYANTSGNEETVAVVVDNGNFNAGTGSNQDIMADAQGEVV